MGGNSSNLANISINRIDPNLKIEKEKRKKSLPLKKKLELWFKQFGS